MVTFGGRGPSLASPSSKLHLHRGSTPLSSRAVLLSARKALEDVGTFLSSREADISPREEAMSRREATTQHAVTEMSEELSKAKAERDLLEALRQELDEDASRKVAEGLQEGQKMLAAVQEKLIGDSNHFEMERRAKEAALVSRANQLSAWEYDIRQWDINLDIHEVDLMEREGALGDRLVYITSCEERASSREIALDVRATKLVVDQGDLTKRRAQFHDMMNDQLPRSVKHSPPSFKRVKMPRLACWHMSEAWRSPLSR